MILYAIILLSTAVPVGIIAARIYRGNTDLIHNYHQTGVKDKAGYGKAFGKAMAVIAVAMALSGVISLFGVNAMWPAVAVLEVGLIVGIIAIVRVQKKYNGGVF